MLDLNATERPRVLSVARTHQTDHEQPEGHNGYAFHAASSVFDSDNCGDQSTSETGGFRSSIGRDDAHDVARRRVAWPLDADETRLFAGHTPSPSIDI